MPRRYDHTPFPIHQIPKHYAQRYPIRRITMKKWRFILFGLCSILLTSCAVTTHYSLKENWIDDNDLQYALQHPSLNDWYPKMGDPVVIEYSNDTIYFIYNYHPTLFASVKDGKVYKPTNKDKVEGAWGTRNEPIGFLVQNNKLVGIQRMGEYQTVQDNQQAEKRERSWLPLIIGGVVAAALLITIGSIF